MTDAPYFRERNPEGRGSARGPEEFPWLVECAVIIPFCAAIPIFVEPAIFYDKKCQLTISEYVAQNKAWRL
jgi:hypothetical protein